MVGGLLAVGGCRGAKPATAIAPAEPTVELSGGSGARVTGYYVSRDERHELMGTLPIRIRQSGLTEVSVRKLESQDTLELSAQTRSGNVRRSVPSKVDEGIRVMLNNLSLSTIPPQESLVLPEAGLVKITPYWQEGTWVFDEPARGLEREPFLRGGPEIVNRLAKDVPDAKDGFQLTFAARKFSGFQQKLIWVRTSAGGSCYRLQGTSLEGWWGPAIFRYFREPPKTLYVKAEAGGKGL